MDIQINRFLKLKKKYIVKKTFKDTWAYKYVLRYLYPNENTKLYEFYKKLKQKAMLNMSVEDLWNIKMLFALSALILVLIISKSNVYYSTMEIIEQTDSSSALLFTGDNPSAEKQKRIEENKRKERQIFEEIKSKYNYQQNNSDEITAVGVISQYMEKNKLTIEDQPTEDVARRIYNKIIKYNTAKEVDYQGLVILVVLSFFLPDAFLMFKSYMLKFYIYNEYLKLEVTAIMVGKLEPIKVEEILNVLSDNSKYFKKYIDEIRYNYFNVKDGNARAFDSVLEKVAHKELRYLLKALQQAAEADLKITIENLENQRKSNKEFRNIKEQNKLKKKELIGILMILIVLAAVCVYAFAPFENMMNNFSI
ncbi:MAG: hypothetical protein ACM3UU_05975 [Ignavibacteriales bacterium]